MRREEKFWFTMFALGTVSTGVAVMQCTPTGRLDPRVAPIVDVIDDVACTFVPAGGAEVCESLSNVLDRILKSASVTSRPEPRTCSVTYQGKIVARKLTKGEAERVRRVLEGPEGLDGGAL